MAPPAEPPPQLTDGGAAAILQVVFSSSFSDHSQCVNSAVFDRQALVLKAELDKLKVVLLKSRSEEIDANGDGCIGLNEFKLMVRVGSAAEKPAAPAAPAGSSAGEEATPASVAGAATRGTTNASSVPPSPSKSASARSTGMSSTPSNATATPLPTAPPLDAGAKFAQRLGFQLDKNPGDGSCLLHGLAKLLGSGATSTSLRAAMCAELQQNRARYLPFSTDAELRQLCEEMAPVDHVGLAALWAQHPAFRNVVLLSFATSPSERLVPWRLRAVDEPGLAAAFGALARGVDAENIGAVHDAARAGFHFMLYTQPAGGGGVGHFDNLLPPLPPLRFLPPLLLAAALSFTVVATWAPYAALVTQGSDDSEALRLGVHSKLWLLETGLALALGFLYGALALLELRALSTRVACYAVCAAFFVRLRNSTGTPPPR